MAFRVDDTVYVRRSLLAADDDNICPFYRTTIRHRWRRSAKMDKPDGTLSDWIATSKISSNFGVLIIRIGDFNEAGLLDPLAKSVLQYCRMLLPDDSVRMIALRTELELTTLWDTFNGMCHQVIIVGHGGPEGYLFGQENITSERLVKIFQAPNPAPKEFISLGCQTGKATFGKVFSSAACVSHFIAPFHSVHGCNASLFTQTYLSERLLASRTSKVAFNNARDDLLGAASFRLWKNGTLAAGPA